MCGLAAVPSIVILTETHPGPRPNVGAQLEDWQRHHEVDTRRELDS